MSTAVTPTTPVDAGPPAAGSPLDLPAARFREGLDRRKENRETLMDWIRVSLVDGVDFGRIHAVGKNRCRLAAQGRASECKDPSHWSKAGLFKPGAEKICGMLGLTVHFPTLRDYEGAALEGVELRQIIMRCEIRDAAGNVVADGVGARSLKQDHGDINKALKMAEKSAHIDATLRLAGLSEVFTQDIEEGLSTPTNAPIDDSERDAVEARLQALGIDRDRVCLWLVKATRGRVQSLEGMTPDVRDKLLARLDAWEKEGGQRRQSGGGR